VGRIAAVKPDKARAVEDTILAMYKQGSFSRMDDKMLVRLLDSVATHDTAKRPEIRVCMAPHIDPGEVKLRFYN
jgi:DNA-binding TFAR19-related protein (PDSD5 family)